MNSPASDLNALVAEVDADRASRNRRAKKGQNWWDAKKFLNDDDVDRFYREQTNRSIYSKQDEYPAMTMAQLESREHTDQVRKARKTQGEDAMPLAPGGNPDGTAAVERTAVDWLSEAELESCIKDMDLTPKQEAFLRMRVMGIGLRDISRYIEYKTGEKITFQSIYRIGNSIRPKLLDLQLARRSDATAGVAEVYISEVNKAISRPRSTYSFSNPCDCKTFPHIPCVSNRTRKEETGEFENGEPVVVVIPYKVDMMMCAHCKEKRTLEQFQAMMEGKEY